VSPPSLNQLLAVAGVGEGVAEWQVAILALSPALLKLLAMFTNTISKYSSDSGTTKKCTAPKNFQSHHFALKLLE